MGLKFKKMRQDEIRLEATQRLIELLSNIEHAIAYSLLDRIRYKEYHKFSYLDFGNENDNVSYIINNKFFELAKDNPENWKEKVWSEKRTNLKIGKFIKMMFDEYFPVNQPKDQPTPKPRVDIESFVNMFKAEREKNINYSRFELVNGEDIREWYKQDNYSRFANSETPLGKSCMRYSESSKFLKMYSSNPDIFSMLILKDDAGKLKGRALVWNLELPVGRIFMDRIYTVNDFEIEVFKQYAKDNGWLYRTEQRYGWFNRIADPTNGMIYESKDLLLQATLSKCPSIHYEFFPYLDTLSVYNIETHILSNNGELRRKRNHILLTDYQGRYHNEVDERPRVFSTVYNQEILEEEAVYVTIDQTWCYRGDEVVVTNTGGLTAYNNSDKIVRSQILGSSKYFLKDDCVYSEYMNTYIYKKSAVNAYLDVNKKTTVIIHKNLIGIEFEQKDDIIVYSKELIIKRQEEEKRKIEKEMLKMKAKYKKGSDSSIWGSYKDMFDSDVYYGNTRNDQVSPTPERLEPSRISEEVRPVERVRRSDGRTLEDVNVPIVRTTRLAVPNENNYEETPRGYTNGITYRRQTNTLSPSSQGRISDNNVSTNSDNIVDTSGSIENTSNRIENNVSQENNHRVSVDNYQGDDEICEEQVRDATFNIQTNVHGFTSFDNISGYDTSSYYEIAERLRMELRIAARRRR